MQGASYAEEFEEPRRAEPLPPSNGVDYIVQDYHRSFRYSYASGHIYQLAEAILSYTSESYDLVFFDGEPFFVDPIRPRPLGPDDALVRAIAAHDPSRRDTNDRARFELLVERLD